MHALENEFSRVPLHVASISNIVNEAGIPRGSFYQYFADKEDAFFFLLHEQNKKRKSQFNSLLQQYDGDLCESILAFFQSMISEKENIAFMRNVFLHMTHKMEDTFIKIFSDPQNEEDFQEISEWIDKDKLNINNEKELAHMMQIMMAVMFRNFVIKFAEDLSNQAAYDHFKVELDILKRGIYRYD